MARLIILFVFLFIQFHQQQAANIHHTPLDEIEEPLFPSPVSSSLLNLWYNRLHELQENEQQEDVEHIWKRLSPDFIQLRQRRRFGNTRYGRSLSNDSK
jgi:hypothetical protein